MLSAKPSIVAFNKQTFASLCTALGEKEPAFAGIIERYGFPPFWQREPGFPTLIHIILEQQVSLASAKAAFDQLHHRLGTITPHALLSLSDENLRACYFSRQKMIYARALATAILENKLDIAALNKMPDDDIRSALLPIKGIGHWTIDVYLMMALQRADLFPLGDIALVNSMKKVFQLLATTTREQLEEMTLQWQPHRTIAAFLLWHDYLSVRKKG